MVFGERYLCNRHNKLKSGAALNANTSNEQRLPCQLVEALNFFLDAPQLVALPRRLLNFLVLAQSAGTLLVDETDTLEKIK